MPAPLIPTRVFTYLAKRGPSGNEMKAPKQNLILIRAYLFKWWTKGVAEIVERDGAHIAWYFEKPSDGALPLHARHFNRQVSSRIFLDEIASCRLDIVAWTLRKMLQALTEPAQRDPALPIPKLPQAPK